MDFITQFKAALKVSVPIVAVQTPDPAATIGSISQTTNGRPLLRYDIAGGVAGLNEAGRDVAAAISDGVDPAMLTNPTEALQRFAKLPEKTVVFFMCHAEFLREPSVVQAVWNLRDKNKVDGRMLVLLSPQFQFPAFISQDILVLDEPRPDEQQIEVILKKVYAAASLPEPTKKVLAKAVDATCGLAAYPIEQESFMCLSKTGLDTDALWERKRQAISQIKGCSVYRGAESFSSIKGLSFAMDYCRNLLRGKRRYRGIVFLDELGKMFSGLGGDLSGTTQEMVGAIIKYMQDNLAHGLLFMGVPGTCKSGLAKAIGNEAGIPTIVFDCTAMKGSLVGETGVNVNEALKMVHAVTQGRSLWIGTTNEMEILPPEVRRRFKRGTFFFDIPDRDELASIVAYFMSKHGHKNQPLPDMTNWTGAEVESCCEMAEEMEVSLVQAAKYVVPQARSASDKIEKMRREASGRYLSASYEGFYRYTDRQNQPQATTPMRQVSAGD